MQLQQFSYTGNDIRVITKNGEPWFVAKDVAEILAIANVSDNIKNYPDKEKGIDTIYTPGGSQKVSIISEAGLYRMIFQSRKPEAEGFKDWVFNEVLPSIRKTGSYSKSKKQLSQVRKDSVEKRNLFTDELKKRGFTNSNHYINITYVQKKGLHIPIKKKKDQYNDDELLLTSAAELMTTYHLRQGNINGYHAIKPIASHVAEKVYESTVGMIEEKNMLFAGLEAIR
jgi:prophage antirepressor-like protein